MSKVGVDDRSSSVPGLSGIEVNPSLPDHVAAMWTGYALVMAIFRLLLGTLQLRISAPVSRSLRTLPDREVIATSTRIALAAKERIGSNPPTLN